MCMCVYIYMVLPENIHNPMHTYMHTCMHACMHTYAHTYLHTYIPTCIHTYIHTYIPPYLHSYIHTYILTYLLTYLLTYIHTAYVYVYTGTHEGQKIPTLQRSFWGVLKSDMSVELIASSRWGFESMRADMCTQIENFSSRTDGDRVCCVCKSSCGSKSFGFTKKFRDR